MIKIFSITVYKKSNNEKIYYESFRDKQIRNNNDINDWAYSIEKQWESITKLPCKAYVVSRAKPTIELDMMALLRNTAIIMEQDLDKVLSGSRKREYVDVKKTACMILFDADYNPMDIEKGLPIKNRMVYNYRTKMENRMTYEVGYEEEYKKIKAKVLDITIGITDQELN